MTTASGPEHRAAPGAEAAAARAADLAAALEAVVARLGGVSRPQQEQMVRSVGRSLSAGEHLLVQAGTGTGKSVGYLVPAALHAAGRGKRVVVATATLGLQRQLATRDAPLVSAALEPALGKRLAVSLLKGRSNYVCRLRLDSEVPEDLEPEPAAGRRSELARLAAEVRTWAEATETGDRDDFPGGVDARVWRAFSVSGRECVGRQKCPVGDDCFAEAARDRARSADLIVTNHAMLAIDIQGDASPLPEYDAVVIDEAHDFAESVTRASTQGLAVRQLAALGRPVARALPGGTGLALAGAADRLVDALTAWAAAVPERARIMELPEEVGLALMVVRDACHAAGAELAGTDDQSVGDLAARQRLRAQIDEVHDIAGRVLALADNDVVWWSGADSSAVLNCAPMSVSGLLADGLLAKAPVVATSATLALGGQFEHAARELGMPGSGLPVEEQAARPPADSGGGPMEGARPWRFVDVGSPFDYGRQAILYVPRTLPRPGREGVAPAVLAQILQIVQAAGGRTLVLASSWRSVDAIRAALEAAGPAHGVAVLAQARGVPPGPVVAHFAEQEKSVLVGTMSLWQGIDVPGPSLSCVVIERLPFPRPDDPVLAARQSRVDRSGGSGFFAVSVPRAALLLAQGAGRLIRHVEDRGVVAVLDPRLASAGYGPFLVKSLPPMWRTADQQVALSALTRLAAAADARMTSQSAG